MLKKKKEEDFNRYPRTFNGTKKNIFLGKLFSSFILQINT